MLSVVTPFFNTAAYLGECIESVLAQSLGDFEYLLVDNHSNDGSADIAATYAAKDRRIRVIRPPEFLAQVPNYNFALANVAPAARYVKIVQADDWLFPRCLTEMVELADANPRVGIVGSYTLKNTEVHGTGLPPSRRVISGREACRLHLLEGVYMFGSPTALLFRGEVVRGRRPFYADGRFHEDTEAVYEILRDYDFGFVPQVLSFARVHEQSITGGARSYDPNALDRLILVKLYGRDFLAPDEYARCLAEAETRYYRRLAEALLARRAGGYWDYHRRGLATIGETIDKARVAQETVPAVLDWILTPKKIVRALRGSSS